MPPTPRLPKCNKMSSAQAQHSPFFPLRIPRRRRPPSSLPAARPRRPPASRRPPSLRISPSSARPPPVVLPSAASSQRTTPRGRASLRAAGGGRLRRAAAAAAAVTAGLPIRRLRWHRHFAAQHSPPQSGTASTRLPRAMSSHPREVPVFEHSLHTHGTKIIKIWLDVSDEEQARHRAAVIVRQLGRVPRQLRRGGCMVVVRGRAVASHSGISQQRLSCCRTGG